MKLISGVLLACSFFQASAMECYEAPKDEPQTDKKRLVIKTNPIFDESDQDSFWLHSFANAIHINTQEKVVEDLLPFSLDSELTEEDIAEAERLLREAPYLRDAKVELIPNCDSDDSHTLAIETWDNWSLLPSVSFGRKGGENKYSFGFKEDNFLGYGIGASVRYRKTHERSGYDFALYMPLNIIPHATLLTEYADNDDGAKSHLLLSKPFYSLNSNSMYSVDILDEEKVDTIDQNGDLAWGFGHKIKSIEVVYGWLINDEADSPLRIKTGIKKEQHKFYDLDSEFLEILLSERDFLYPWIGVEYVQSEFEILSDVYLIGNREDVNLGWQLAFNMGIETEDQVSEFSCDVHFNASASKGKHWNNTLVLFSASSNGCLTDGKAEQYKVSTDVEVFYRFAPQWTFYGRAHLLSSKNQYFDTPVVLGGETGVRGYPLEYKHGEHFFSSTAELRLNPNIEIYQLFNVGFAAFADVGQTYGDTVVENQIDSAIASAGIGTRIYSSRSSNANVVHVDIIRPLVSGENVDEWQWRVMVKRTL